MTAKIWYEEEENDYDYEYASVADPLKSSSAIVATAKFDQGNKGCPCLCQYVLYFLYHMQTGPLGSTEFANGTGKILGTFCFYQMSTNIFLI